MSKWKSYIRSFLGRELVKDTIWTTIFSTIGKSVGFLIPFFIAAWFGVSAKTDAFFFAYGLIILLATIFSPAAESIIVPFVTEMKTKGEDVGVFVGKILGMSAVGLCALSALFLLIIKPCLAFATRFSPEGLHLIFIIFLESIPLVLLLVWTSILSGSLNAYKVFSIPALSPALRAVVTLCFIFIFKETLGVHAIALGYVMGEIFRLGILLIILSKLNLFRLKLSIRSEKRIIEFFRTSSYQIAGMSMLVFTPIINKTMASWLGEGYVSLLEYADRLYIIPITFISSGLMVTLLSYWSENYYIKGKEKLKRDIYKAAKVVGGISLLITFFFLTTKSFLVETVYGYGKFPQDQLSNIETIFFIYLFGLTPYFLSQVYVRAFLVRKHTKVLLFTALLKIVATIICNLIFMRILGIYGIALATSTVSFLSFLFMSFYLRWKII